MIKIALTGTIAAGKTSAAILFKRRGFPVFNADQYARMATHSSNVCFPKIIEAFGEDIIAEDGDIDRAKLAAVVFSDEQKRLTLNSIVHPYVKEGLLRFFEHRQDDKAVFAEVPLLFEAGWQDLFDHIIVVTCSRETAVARMMEDRDYTREEAEARYNSQIDPGKQIALADKVICNDGSLQDLDHEINLYVKGLREEIRNGSKGK